MLMGLSFHCTHLLCSQNTAEVRLISRAAQSGSPLLFRPKGLLEPHAGPKAVQPPEATCSEGQERLKGTELYDVCWEGDCPEKWAHSCAEMYFQLTKPLTLSCVAFRATKGGMMGKIPF